MTSRKTARVSMHTSMLLRRRNCLWMLLILRWGRYDGQRRWTLLCLQRMATYRVVQAILLCLRQQLGQLVPLLLLVLLLLPHLCLHRSQQSVRCHVATQILLYHMSADCTGRSAIVL